MQITDHDEKYWRYEYDVVALYFLPLLKRWGVTIKGAQVLDIGCGDGGGISALCDAGMDCKGFDLEQRRVDLANIKKGDRTLEIVQGDLFCKPVPFNNEKFDLVILHDVIEHLEDKMRGLDLVSSYLKPTGRLLVTFPPYFSAYGAHQQLLQTRWARIPFFHLLPFSLSVLLPKLKEEHQPFVREIKKIARLKMGIRSFEQIVRATGILGIEQKISYFIRPNHIRFGLKPVEAGIFGKIPLIREFVVSGVAYLLSQTGNTAESA